jgi:hypothetical protein
MSSYEPIKKSLSVYYGEIASRIKWGKENPPNIILTIGSARTGTTASLNVFRGSKIEDPEGKLHDIPVAYQHFKAGLRHAMLGWKENPDWEFQIPDTPLFYMKDTIGPYTQKESLYNPLLVFKQMGYPLDKIYPVIFYRNPLDSFASWIEKWSSIIPRGELINNFITATHTLLGVKKEIETIGLPHSTFVYEAIRDNSPNTAALALFKRINQTLELTDHKKIVATENTTENWNRLDQEGWHPNQPARYEIPRIDQRVHHDAKTKTSWEFKIKTPEMLAKMISPRELTMLEEAGIHNQYNEFRLEALHNLNLPIKELEPFEVVREAYNIQSGVEGYTLQARK